MKKKILYLICIMLLTAVSVCAEDSVLPSFKLDDINGKPRTLESIRGDSSNPVIVNFWATWCSPCKKEMPELQNLLKKFGKDKLSIIAISVDKPEKISGAKSYVKSKKFEFTFLFDPNKQYSDKKLHIPAIPYLMLLDGENRVVYKHMGYKAGDEVELEKEISRLLGDESAEENPEVLMDPVTTEALGTTRDRL